MKYLETDAVLSDCGMYRYMLRRTWDFNLLRALVVMLNPSTADASVDDATIRSLYRLLSFLGYGSFEVVNLLAFRSTDPAGLLHTSDPFGPRNREFVAAAVGRCDVAICAWGAHHMATGTSTTVKSIIRTQRPAMFCFGKTKGGAPKHPLYLKTGTQLEKYGD